MIPLAPPLWIRRGCGEAGAGQRAVRFLRQPLYANAFFLAANTAVGAVAGFLFWSLAAHLYSAEQVGLGSATLAAISLLGLMSNLGLGMGLVRYLPGAAERRSELINLALTIAVLAGLCAAAVFLAGLTIWSPGLVYLRGSGLYLLAFAAFAAGDSANAVLPMVFVGLRRAQYSLIMTALAQVMRLALLVALIPWRAFGLVVSGGTAGLLSVVIGLVLLGRVVHTFRPQPALSRALSSTLVPFGLSNHGANLALTAPFLILPIMVVNSLGAAAGAHFYISFFLGALMLTGTYALSTSLFAEGSHDVAGLGRATRHALIGSVALAGLGAGILFLIGGRLLLVFGGGYAAHGLGLVRLLALSALPSSLSYVYLSMLRVRERVQALVLVSVAISIVTLGLSYLLLPRVGIVGVGIAMLAGQGLGAVVAIFDILVGRSSGRWTAPDR